MGNWYESMEVFFFREQLMIRDLVFDVGADLYLSTYYFSCSTDLRGFTSDSLSHTL